jgi:hypothetical protein
MSLIAPMNLPNGSRTWVAPEVQDFVKRLEALDPRLALVQNENGSWSIYRVPEDGSEPRHIMRSTPGAKLDPQVIERLRARDTRAGHDPVEEMIKANDKAMKDRQDRTVEERFLAIDRMLSKAWRGRVPQTDEGFETML